MVNIMLRYLGIKTKILNPIKIAIDQITPENGKVLDLFAGSCSVSQFLMNDYTVFTNDYQKYSYITAKSLIEYHDSSTVNNLNEKIVFGDYYRKNKDALESRFNTPLLCEKQLLDQIGDIYYGEKFDAFTDFFNNSPYAGHIKDCHTSYSNCLQYFDESELTLYQNDHSRFPYSLFTMYYGNPYFSLHQCIEIDSIKYSIDQLLLHDQINQEQYNIYLSFLLYCLNLIVISVGDHFAQPQKIKDVSSDFSGPRDLINLRERKKIVSKKRIIVRDLFIEKLYDYKSNYVAGTIDNKAFNSDYKDLLSRSDFKDLSINTVYIDPPYTNAHYSRFYHIPETLVKYDYPDIAYFGRYRTDRYQSGFCIKTQASQEFETMLKLCKTNNLNAVISYSDTAQCILSIDDITTICKKYYPKTSIDNVAHMYRNFGQKPNRVLAKEYIITCYA